jgi:hypothetical protein
VTRGQSLGRWLSSAPVAARSTNLWPGRRGGTTRWDDEVGRDVVTRIWQNQARFFHCRLSCAETCLIRASSSRSVGFPIEWPLPSAALHANLLLPLPLIRSVLARRKRRENLRSASERKRGGRPWQLSLTSRPLGTSNLKIQGISRSGILRITP